MEIEWKKKAREALEQREREACNTYVNHLPLTGKAREAALKDCTDHVAALPLESQLNFIQKVGKCETEAHNAPTSKGAEEFRAWCYADLPKNIPKFSTPGRSFSYDDPSEELAARKAQAQALLRKGYSVNAIAFELSMAPKQVKRIKDELEAVGEKERGWLPLSSLPEEESKPEKVPSIPKTSLSRKKFQTKTEFVIALLEESAHKKTSYTLGEVAQIASVSKRFVKDTLKRIRQGRYPDLDISEIKLRMEASLPLNKQVSEPEKMEDIFQTPKPKQTLEPENPFEPTSYEKPYAPATSGIVTQFVCKGCKRQCNLVARSDSAPLGCPYMNKFLRMPWEQMPPMFSAPEKVDIYLCKTCPRSCTLINQSIELPLSCPFQNAYVPVIWSGLEGDLAEAELLPETFQAPRKQELLRLEAPSGKPFEVNWKKHRFALRLNGIVEVLYKRVCLYNHYNALKSLLSYHIMNLNSVLVRQLSAMPQMFMLFAPTKQKGERDTIIIVDPVGMENPIASDYVKPLFKPNFIEILRVFLDYIEFKEFKDSHLKKYNIKICISHVHPDHWGGLSFLLHQLRAIGYPLDRIQIFVPKGFKFKGIQEQREQENNYMMRKFLWNQNIIKDIRLLCDLYYGVYPDIVPAVTEVEDQMDLDGYTFKVYPNIHGGSVLLFSCHPILLHTHEVDTSKTYHFIDDLFLPSYAISTSLPPFASFDALERFLLTFEEPSSDQKFFLWSHYYPSYYGPPYPEAIDFPQLRSVEEPFAKEVEGDYYERYEEMRLQNPKEKESIFRRICHQMLTNQTSIQIILRHMHQIHSRAPPASVIVQITRLLLRYANRPKARLQIQWGKYSKAYQKFLEVYEKPKLPPQDFDVVERVLLTEDGKEKATFDPLHFQLALLVVILVVNLVQYSEEEFAQRHPYE